MQIQFKKKFQKSLKKNLFHKVMDFKTFLIMFKIYILNYQKNMKKIKFCKIKRLTLYLIKKIYINLQMKINNKRYKIMSKHKINKKMK